MFERIKNILLEKGINCFGAIPLSECEIKREYLLKRSGLDTHTATVVMLAVPYYTEICDRQRNVSAYAVSRDYHLFLDSLFSEMLGILRTEYPQNRFDAFCDHSPINEITAAAKAGLGVIGKNHLIITEKYSSYVFLGEIITDATLPCKLHEILTCEGCNACAAACRIGLTANGECLSALTQKKGVLSGEEHDTIFESGCVWGCDDCQQSCPHTISAMKNKTIYSPIPFFYENAVPYLTYDTVSTMPDEEFGKRAYSWRGRAVIERNLLEFEKRLKNQKTEEK